MNAEKLILITQPHRSGGTLLGQLFDSHPQIYAHPAELQVWKPKQYWGEIAPFTQFNPVDKTWDQCFQELEQEYLTAYGKLGGYQKVGINKFSQAEYHKFNYSNLDHANIFKSKFENLSEINRSSVLMAYLLSFFEAWRQLDHYPRKYITTFIPHMWGDHLSVIRFFNDFPNGTIIYSLRRPDTWLNSVLGHRKIKSRDPVIIESLLKSWWESVRNLYEYNSILANKKIIPIVYEDLIGQSELTMKKLCKHLDLDFHPTLLMPTFCGEPIYPNSSFDINQKGIIQKSFELINFTPEINDMLEPYLQEYDITRKLIQNIYYS